MATSHVVTVKLVNVDPTGSIIDKSSPTTTLAQLLKTSTEHRVVPDSGIASSTGYPTPKDYLAAEAALGFLFKHMDNYTIITEHP